MYINGLGSIESTRHALAISFKYQLSTLVRAFNIDPVLDHMLLPWFQ